jgi:hypothetical protein
LWIAVCADQEAETNRPCADPSAWPFRTVDEVAASP